MSREIWIRLGADMRAMRTSAGVSLRQAEGRSGWGRGTLSQVENGKARPSRALVEWYESEFGGDELLLSTYAEARGARRDDRRAPAETRIVDGDAFELSDPLLPQGALVRAGAAVTIGWTLRNTGAVRWRGRHLRRLGAHAAAQLITSPSAVPIAECPAGGAVDIRFDVRAPSMPGTLAAYWQIADDAGRPFFALPHLLSAVFVVR